MPKSDMYLRWKISFCLRSTTASFWTNSLENSINRKSKSTLAKQSLSLQPKKLKCNPHEDFDKRLQRLGVKDWNIFVTESSYTNMVGIRRRERKKNRPNPCRTYSVRRQPPQKAMLHQKGHHQHPNSICPARIISYGIG